MNCNPGDVGCDGHQLATCQDNAWVRTPCPQTCVENRCAAWLSCRDVADAGCGANQATSCCETKAVPGGTFNRHNNASRPATVSGFELDTFEVTVGRFRTFVAAGMGTQANPPAPGVGAHPKIANSGWQSGWNEHLPANAGALASLLTQSGGSWTTTPGLNERKPIVYVTWFVAFAFCAWDGARLPTRAELSYAATGGSEQRVYPWSVPPTSTSISSTTNAAFNCAFDPPSKSCPASYCNLAPQNSPCSGTVQTNCTADGGSCVFPSCTGCDEPDDLAPVGNYAAGVGRWGHFDLAGNVKEFVLDRDPGGNGDPPPGACVDCALLLPANITNEDVVLLGGDYEDTSTTELRNSEFLTFDHDLESRWTGFRCARD
jgi:formylglycine-generating enzyme required for sulfatase activity